MGEITSGVRSYRDLKVWQKAMDLAVIAHALARGVPTTRASPLVGQLQRSAASVPANIAEGAGRRSRADFLRHLSIANGSLKETETHLLLIERLALAPAEDIGAALGLCNEIGRTLTGLARSLRSDPRRDPSRSR